MVRSVVPSPAAARWQEDGSLTARHLERRRMMVVSVADPQQLMDAYGKALLSHGDYAQYFSDDVVAVLEGIEPQRFEGREAVTQWIEAAHALGEIKFRTLFACERHAAGEFDFVRTDGVAVPYAVTYDIEGGKITALRLFFTGPVQT
jgi:hypothetical protein